MDFVDEAESQLIRDGKMLGQRIPDVAKEYLRAAQAAEVGRVTAELQARVERLESLLRAVQHEGVVMSNQLSDEVDLALAADAKGEDDGK